MTIAELKIQFFDVFGGDDEADLRVFYSPGRVNLIGEHIDYNGGYVFPAALTMGTTIIVRKRDDNVLRFAASDLPGVVEGRNDNLNDYRELEWGNYQFGVAYELEKAGYTICGCDMLYHDTVPHGGGLSSSAAIEVATAVAFATLSNEINGINEPVDMVEMSLVGQRTENNYCSVNCGIMDQFASAMGRKDNAILLNCGTLEYKYAPLDLDGYKIVISNTKVKRGLASSKYNERRGECEEGLALLKTKIDGIECLCDISVDDFEANKMVIENEIVRKRCEHVVYENDRVLCSVDALNDGDIFKFGQLINQSGDSLRDLYEVTGVELDTMVEEARKIDGVIGSRMTGAGFGGCTVSIVAADAVDTFIENVGKAYEERVNIKPEFYVSEIGDGGRELV